MSFIASLGEKERAEESCGPELHVFEDGVGPTTEQPFN